MPSLCNSDLSYLNIIEQQSTTCIYSRAQNIASRNLCAMVIDCYWLWYLYLIIVYRQYDKLFIVCCLVMMEWGWRMRRLSTILTHLKRSIPSFSCLSGKHVILVFSCSLPPKPTLSIAPPPRPPAFLFSIHLSFPLSLGLSTRWVTGLLMAGAECLVLQTLSSTNTWRKVIQTDQTWWCWNFPPSSLAVPRCIQTVINTVSTTEWRHFVLIVDVMILKAARSDKSNEWCF